MPSIVRVGDRHACGAVNVEGSPDCYLNSLPIHRHMDRDDCNGVQIEASTVSFINSRGCVMTGHRNDQCHDNHPWNCNGQELSPEDEGSPDGGSG